MKRRLSRGRLWQIAVGLATGVVVLLLVLIGIGWLVLPSSPAKEVTVVGVEWKILQGTTPTGIGWFGPDTINVTGTGGFPISVSTGGSFVASLILSNLDSTNHTVYSVLANSPFHVSRTSPTLPNTVVSGEDDWTFAVTVSVPSSPSASSVTVVLTVNAIS